MKAGLRLGVLLLLGVVTLLAFMPLFFAVSTYTNVAFQRVASAGALAATRSLGQLYQAVEPNLATSRAPEPFAAVCVYDKNGTAGARAGERQHTALCPKQLTPIAGAEGQQLFSGRIVTTAHFAAFSLVTVANPNPAASPTPLLRIIALYTGLFALVLFGASYVALTHFLVRPLGELARAASQVAQGARGFSAPLRGARELSELNQSLATMTEHLVGREEALRKKVSELEEATASLRQAQERLIRSERLASVGRLAAGLAHEIGNPISAILGLQELILTDQVNPQEQRDFVERMHKETERIHQILRDLLQFARPARADGSLAAPGDVAAVIEDTLALVAPQTAFKGIAITPDIEVGLPLVAVPHEQLVQVLLNLLLNAADACGSTGTIRVSAKHAHGQVELVVEDSGPGVSPAVREQLFEPFVTTKEVGKGTGLGLAVCRGLVEAAQGNITLDTTSTAGARFIVELPTAPTHPQATRA